MSLHLDLIAIVVKDMSASLAFYRELSLPLDHADPAEDHVECTLPNGLRIAWDTEDLMKSFSESWAEPAGHRMGLAFRCDSPSEVDETFNQLAAKGYRGHKAPWDAFWGQRYAQIEDPDGNVVDLFASIE